MDLVRAETTLRQHFNNGTEAIIITPNPRTDTTNGLYVDPVLVRRLADATGAAVADVYGFVQWQIDNGQSVRNGDGIHPNDAGHALYAADVRSVINTTPQLSDRQMNTLPVFSLSTLPNKQGARFDAQFNLPGGTGTNAVASSSYWSLMNILGLGHTTYNIAPGQYLLTQSPGCYEMWIMTELPAGNTATIFGTNSGGAFFTNTITGSANPQITRLLSNTNLDLVAGSAEYPATGIAPFTHLLAGRVTCASITGSATCVPVVGVLYSVPDRTYIPYEAMRFGGTWAEETMTFDGQSTVKYTDTANSLVVIPFDGDYLELWLGGNANAGKITVRVDGEQPYSSFNVGGLSGNTIWHLVLMPGNASGAKTPIGTAGVRKFARISLTNAGASPSAQDRSLALIAASSSRFCLRPAR